MLIEQEIALGNAVVSNRISGITTWLARAGDVFATLNKRKHNRLPRELTRLSDEILLDIGVDPRLVPNPAGELLPRPDLSRTGLVTPIWRTTAMS